MLTIENAVSYARNLFPTEELVGTVFVASDPVDYVKVYLGRGEDAICIDVWVENGELYGEF